MAATVSELQVVVSADTSKADKELSSFSSKLGSVGSTMALAFGGAVVAGVAAVGGALVASTASAAGFEKQLSAISAVSGATADEMSQISALALQLGADTSFSASEAAQGIEELIKAGVSVADVMGGGAAAALSLAAAGGLSVAESAEIASNAMNVFSLKGADVGHVADVIAGAANASAIDVHDFGMSLSAAGAVAATVGIGFDDLGTAIAVMGQAGIKGSDAGTSLKTMLLNLTPSTKGQIAVAKELGIVTADGANKFFDATGKAKSLSEIAGVLQTATAGLTEQQKLQALQTLFGTDAIRAAAIMAKAGSEGFDEMAASIGKVTAEAVAAERLNNLTGVWEQLTGSLETAGITIGQHLLPPLTELLKWGTEALNGLIPTLEEVGKQIGSAMSEGIVKAKDLFRQLSDAWGTVKQAFEGNWSPDASIEPLALAAGNAAIKLRDLRDAVQQVNEKAGQMGAWENFSAGMETMETESLLASRSLSGLAEALARLNSTVSDSNSKLSFLAGVVKGVSVIFELFTINLGQIIDTTIQVARSAINLTTVFANLGKSLYALATGDVPMYEKAIREGGAAMADMLVSNKEFADNTAARAKQAFEAISRSAGTELPATAASVESNMSAANQSVGEHSAGMQQFMEANGAGMTTAAQTAGQGVATATETGMTTAASAVDTNGTAMSASMDAAGTGMTTAAQAGATGVTSAVEGQGPLAVAAADSMGTGMSGAIEQAGPLMASAAESGASGAVAAVNGQTGAASAAGQSVGQAAGSGIRDGIMGMINSIASAAASVVSRAISAARSAAGRGDDYDDERAVGGPVRSGGTYLVGERGPELFTPGAAGYITPNHMLTAPAMASASGGGGRMDSMEIRLKIGDQEAGRLFVTGYQVAVQERGLLPAGTL